MTSLKILHISDLHYSNVKQKEIEYIRDAILLDVDKFINKNNLTPDFVIFSGDLVFKPDSDISSIEVLEEAYNFFIAPLLEKLNLSKDNIFITAGNHDINRNILTRKDTRGLKSYAEENKTVANELITEIITKSTDIKHLQQFNTFVNNLSNSHLIYSNDIFNVSIKTVGKITIGIVNLNSTILSFENDSYGKLIIGEEQLRLAYKYIKDCDIKIANVHHSVNWLVWFEQQLVKQFYYQHFNLVFIGHEHMEQPELVNFNDEDTLIINSASIFQGRNNTNGYSLLDYSFDDKSMDIYIREYDDRATKFSTVTFQNTPNKYKYEFNILEKSKNKKNVELILDRIKLPIKAFIKKELLINTAKNEDNNIEDIFVEPNIYTKSEFIDTETEKELYTITRIIYSDKPVIIKGIESSGKTTFLNYLANEYLNMKSPELRIPILLNYYDIKDSLTDTLLFSKTIEYLRKLEMDISNRELESLLRDGNLVFLIDNFITSTNDIISINKILENPRFKNNQYIFTAKEEIFNSIENINDSTKDIDYENFTKLFLYNLKRDKAREYFELYFRKTGFDNDEFEGIYKFISKLNIPLTIFNYTLIAHVYDNQRSSFKPVNEAYLLDIFMENLLEKLDVTKNIHIGSLGYNLKSSYLIYIATWMVNNNIFNIEKYKLHEITSQFIQELKREKEGINIELFIDYMEQKGIFVILESNQYRFRYRAFLEFFIAKGMEKDKNLKEYVIDENNYLNYRNEIRYYSGLHGEDQDLIIHFNTILYGYQDYFNKIKENDATSVYMPDIDIEDKKEISVEQISHANQDKRLEAQPNNIQKHNSTKITENKKDDSDENNDEILDKKIFQTNVLLSNIIRNSEQLREPVLKIESLKLVTKNLSKFFQARLNKTGEMEHLFLTYIDTIENTNNITKKDVKEFTSIMNILLSQAFMGLANKSLSSDSLFTIYDEILSETDDNILKLFIISTFIQSENKQAINIIEKIIKDESFSKNRFLMMSLFFKIYHAIKVREVHNRYKNLLENILTEIIMKLRYNEVSGKGSLKKKQIEGGKQELVKSIKDLVNKNS